MNRYFKYALLSGVGLVMATAANAATDGTLGTASTGTLDVSLSIAGQVRLTGLTDFAFGAYGGSGDLTNNDDVCVYRNGAGTYSVTATTNRTDFVLQNAGSDTIAFDAYFNDASGTTGRSPLTYNTALTSQTGADTSSQDCDSHASDNANISVLISEAALQAAPAGSYSATMTVVVAPE